MAIHGGDIEVGLKLKFDKSSLTDIKNSLNQIKNLGVNDLLKLNPELTKKQAQSLFGSLRSEIYKIDKAFDKAFDVTTGTTNLITLNQELRKLNISKIASDFNKAGDVGANAFKRITTQAVASTNQFKKTQTVLDKMGTTLTNTIKWGISSSIMNNFTGAVQRAYGYVKNLDTALNDIRIVTGKSSEEMERFAVQANNAAKALGKTTNDYTKASLIYYQQGLSDEETAARTDVTLKAANVTGQAASEVSEQLTAVWNGYKVSAQETELYVDKLAKVAADTAADLEELSTGMSKVASAANIMGVDVDHS